MQKRLECPKCNKLLAVAEGREYTLEIKCPRCKTLHTHKNTSFQEKLQNSLVKK